MCTILCMDLWSSNRISGPNDKCMFNFLKNCHTLPKQLNHFIFVCANVLLILKLSCVSYLVVRKILCISEIEFFVIYMHCKYFLPFHCLHAYALNGVCGWTEVFYFNGIYFIIFFLLWFVLHVLYTRNSCLPKDTKFSPIFSFKFF